MLCASLSCNISCCCAEGLLEWQSFHSWFCSVDSLLFCSSRKANSIGSVMEVKSFAEFTGTVFVDNKHEKEFQG